MQSVRRTPKGVVINAEGCAPETFDAVFLACHSDQALRMLADPSKVERDVLGAIRYQRNEAVLHTDSALMPRRKQAWASWNYHLPAREDVPVTLTYHMNRLQRLDTDAQYFVTLNSGEAIHEDAIIREITYEHPVFTTEAVDAQRRKEELDGANRTYFCGAYWRYGFHEDGVISALTALERFRQVQEDEEQHLPRAS